MSKSKKPEVTTTETANPHLIIYTDGSCRPSRGWGGWGVHGYGYVPTTKKKGTGCKKAVMTTEGYQVTASASADIEVTHYLDSYGAPGTETSNNAMELEAMVQALQYVNQTKPESVKIYSDSSYVVNGINGGIQNAVKRGWKTSDGRPIANQPQWTAILKEIGIASESKIPIRVSWVKGHDGLNYFGNVVADQNANRGRLIGINHMRQNPNFSMSEPLSTLEIHHESKANGYWSGRTEYERLVEYPHWFFIPGLPGSEIHSSGKTVYFQVNLGEDNNLLHRKLSTAAYSVLYMATPVPEMEVVRKAMQSMASNRLTTVTQVDLKVLFSEESLRDLFLTGTATWNFDYDRQRISLYDDRILAEEIRPTNLALRGMDTLSTLQSTLDEFLNPSEKSLLQATEITDLIYETSGKKVKLHKSLTVTTKELEVTAYRSDSNRKPVECRLPLLLGLDMPSRNTLSAIASPDVQVWVITWPMSDYAVRYATVVKQNENVGIWSCVFANLFVHSSPPTLNPPS